jgi:uncharacterized protein YxjI
MTKVFELHQKLTFMVNEYRVLEDTAEGSQELIAYAKQKRMAIREKFTLYSDESQKQVLATSAARSIIDMAPVMDIADGSGKPLAVVKKEFKKSLISSTWSAYDPKMEEVLFTIKEKSMAVAVGRRLWEILPIPLELPFPMKFHFQITQGDKLAGEYIKTTLWRDHYALRLEDEFKGVLNEKAWMIIAVLLDAMQSR